MFLLCAAVCLAACAPAAVTAALPSTPPPFQHDGLESFPSRLHVQGSQILDESGQVVILKGLMAPDLTHINIITIL